MSAKSVPELYADELNCIRQIINYSESFLHGQGEFEVENVKTLLNERQPWIDILKNIESELQARTRKSDEIDHVKQEIAELGNSLIALDAKIMDILVGQKQNIVKEMMKTTDNINRRRKEEAPRIINIKQE